jgi:hypothetical protein
MRTRCWMLLAVIGILCALTIPAKAVPRMVIVEGFTQWNCPYCADWNPAERTKLRQIGSANAIGFKVHAWFPGANNDPMYLWNSSEAAARVHRYGVDDPNEGGVPDGYIDGATRIIRENPPATGAHFIAQLNARHNVPAPCTISLRATASGPSTTTVDVTGTITATDSALANTYLYLVLVTDSARYIGGSNGERDFFNVFRDLWPGASGRAVSVALGGTYDFSATLNKDSTWDPDLLTVIAFLQDPAPGGLFNGGYVHQGAWVEVMMPYGVEMTNSDPTQYLGDAGTDQVYTFHLRNRGHNDDTYWVSLRGSFPGNWIRSIEAIGVPGNPDSIQVPLASHADTWITVHVNPNGQRGSTQFSVNVSSPASETATAAKAFRFMVHPEILVVNDDAGAESNVLPYYLTVLSGVDNSRWGYWNWQAQTLDAVALENADLLIWYTGGSPNGGSLDDTEQSVLRDYLDYGGNLLLTGQGIARDISTSSLLSNYLHTVYDSLSVRRRDITGVSGEVTSDGLSFSITGGDGASNQQRPCAIHPADAMASVNWNFAGVPGHAGVRVQGPNYRAIFMAFGFEAINDAAIRTTVMMRAVDWLLNIDAVDDHPLTAPRDFVLDQNYPNPFNPETVIPFSLPERAYVSLKVYDLLGHEVATLVQGTMNAGTYRARFDGHALASGVYFYRIEAQAGAMARVATRKLVLLK